jgi:hypothetical protein
MPIRKLLQTACKFEIQVYKRPKDPKGLIETHVPYSGWPQKHPLNAEKIILVADPFSNNTFYYEFETRDIGYIQELPSIVTLDDLTLPMVRVWIRRGAVGTRCTPFRVEPFESGR